MRQLQQQPGATCRVSLRTMAVTGPDGSVYRFVMDPARRTALRDGIDDIGLSARKLDAIAAFQSAQLQAMPWLRSGT